MLAILLLFIAPILARAALYVTSSDPRSWRDADWSATGLLPAAADFAPARVIIFTGTAGAWKGVFSVHSWIVLKHANASRWQRYDVVGWGQPVRLNNWPVDGKWYGNMPVMIADISGLEAETLIPRIEAAVKDYNYSQTGDYRIWPGPNSNSFIAAILRSVPHLVQQTKAQPPKAQPRPPVRVPEAQRRPILSSVPYMVQPQRAQPQRAMPAPRAFSQPRQMQRRAEPRGQIGRRG